MVPLALMKPSRAARFVVAVDRAQGQRVGEPARLPERSFAISQRPVAPFHAFEVLACECILYRLQRDPASLRQFEIFFWVIIWNECALWT